MPICVGVDSVCSTATPVTVGIAFVPGSGAVECVEDCFVIRATGVVDAVVGSVCVDSPVLVGICVSTEKEHGLH